MTVIARDAVASDHLVYAWPFPIGPECEVSCSDDESVIMCPAWLVGDRLGPGRHLWRTPDPSRPVSAYFVLNAPVEVSFDLTTSFALPSNGMPIRLRATGSLQVRCVDPGLLIAQFVGLPFDSVNDGILRSVSRSVERMLARLLTRRVVMSGTPIVVTDMSMLPGIVEELIAYNPTAGAVFGIELIRMGHLNVLADDGSSPYLMPPLQPPRHVDRSGGHRAPNGDAHRSPAAVSGEIVRRAQSVSDAVPQEETPPPPVRRHTSVPPTMPPIVPPAPLMPPILPPMSGPPPVASGEIIARAKSPEDIPPQRHAAPIEIQSGEDITQPGVSPTRTPVPGTLRMPSPQIIEKPPVHDSRGSIMGVGMSSIGMGSVAGEIPTKVPPGGRVLVPGPNGLMQSATVRQLLQGYYELEVGSSGETIWVPMNGVVPD